MEPIKKLLRTPSALALIVVAFITLIGVIIQTNSPKELAKLSIAATSTAEAENRLSENSLTSPNVPIAVDSTPGWHPTGVTVVEGDIIKIKVVGGKWTPYRVPFPEEIRDQIPEETRKELSSEIYINGYRETDGSGSTLMCELDDKCLMLGRSVGGLIARINDSMYFIGNQCEFKATESGQVFLQINDDPTYPTNNFGVLAVEVSVINDVGFVTMPNCGVPNQ